MKTPTATARRTKRRTPTEPPTAAVIRSDDLGSTSTGSVVVGSGVVGLGEAEKRRRKKESTNCEPTQNVDKLKQTALFVNLYI